MFKYIVLVSALLLASCAAFFSMSGIIALFSGASIAVGIMAGAIELGKIVSVSVLYRHWKHFSKVLRIYLVSALVIASIITTAGIYGFLSAAYSSVAVGARENENKITLINDQITTTNQQLTRLEDRSKSLETARSQQEDRLNRLVGHNGLATQQEIVRQAERDLRNVQNQITTLSNHRDSLQVQKTTAENNITSDAKIGSFYYFSKAINVPLDSIVKWFILVLVMVFDPLSISLLFAYNVIRVKEETKEIVETPVIEEKVEVIEEIIEAPVVKKEVGDTRYGQSIA
jgi:hypothetical protein